MTQNASCIVFNVKSSCLIGDGAGLYIVSGRVHGDDDDTVYPVLADSDEQAAETFREQLIDDNDLDPTDAKTMIYVISNEQIGTIANEKPAHGNEVPDQLKLSAAYGEAALSGDRKEGEKVAVLLAGNDIIITVKEEYYQGSFAGTDLEVSRAEMFRRARNVAQAMKLPLSTYNVPAAEAEDDYEVERAIARAKEMGVFTYDLTIFELIDDVDNAIYINGRYMSNCLNPGWTEQVHAEGPDACIWVSDSNDDCGARSYSFAALCGARRQDDGSWIITESGGSQDTVTFHY